MAFSQIPVALRPLSNAMRYDRFSFLYFLCFLPPMSHGDGMIADDIGQAAALDASPLLARRSLCRRSRPLHAPGHLTGEFEDRQVVLRKADS